MCPFNALAAASEVSLKGKIFDFKADSAYEIHDTKNGIEIKVEKLVGVYSNTKSYMGWDNKTFVPTKVIFTR